jgi:hypothetical protein
LPKLTLLILRSPKIEVKDNELGRARATHGTERKIYKILVGKAERKRPLGRPRRRWEDGIIIDFREIDRGGVEWIQLA